MNIQTGSINLGAIKNLRTHIAKEYIEWHYGICDTNFDEGTKTIRFQINED